MDDIFFSRALAGLPKVLFLHPHLALAHGVIG